MRRNLGYVLAIGALLTAACSDNQLPSAPTSDPRPLRPTFLVELPTECATPAAAQRAIDDLLPQLFVIGGGRWITATAYNIKIKLARRRGDTEVVKATVEAFINFTLDAYYAGHVSGGQTPESQARVLKLIYLLYCSNGITPIPDLSGIFDAQNTVLVTNTTPTTVVSDPLDSAAVQVDQGDVPPTVFGTFISVHRTDEALPTSLDWYGIDGYKLGAFEFVANPPIAFDQPVLAGVCISFDDAIVSPNDLRLAHAVEPGDPPAVAGNTILTTAGGTIEIGAYADPSPLGLACDPLPPPTASRGLLGRLLHQFARLVIPERLYAGTTGGSTGGQVRKFSPFAAVDLKLNAVGTGPSSPQYIPVGSSATSAPVTVTVTTRHGAAVGGLPVSFAPGASFEPTPATTDEGGVATSSWSLEEGDNAATATPPQPLKFVTAVDFSVTAVQLTELSITAPASPLADGLRDTPYATTAFTATGGTGGGYAFTVVGGALPGGLGLSEAGVLSGTPTASGSFNFTVQVTSGPLTATRDYALTILAPVIITAPASPLADGLKNAPYPSTTFTATGGNGTYAWTVVGGALPAGLGLSAAGVLGGTPTAYGSFSFTVQVTSGLATATGVYAITIWPPAVITAPASLADGVKGTPYPSTSFSASGGNGTYTWVVSGGALPAGLMLSAAGVLGGTPTAYGTFTFTVQVTSGLATATRAYTLKIVAPVAITTTSPLPYAKKGYAYSKTLQATGGTGTYTWSLTGGALPSGLSLSATGVISGTTTALGTFTFTVRAQSGGQSATKTLSLTVKKPDDHD